MKSPGKEDNSCKLPKAAALVSEGNTTSGFANAAAVAEGSGKVKTWVNLVVLIDDPQFNLYYGQQRNQMILTSREKCFIVA